MKLSAEGIIFMTIAWGIVVTLTVYCFSKVLKTKVKYDNQDDD